MLKSGRGLQQRTTAACYDVQYPALDYECGYNIQPPQAIHTCRPLPTRPLALHTTVQYEEDDLFVVPSCMEHATEQHQRRGTLSDKPANLEPNLTHTCASTISPRFWLYDALFIFT